MTDLSHLRLFATQPHPCSYLENQQATTVFVDPEANIDRFIYTELSHMGFRRSGAHLYRPHCGQCQACISCRIPVMSFTPSRSQRRCWQRNQDIEVREVDSIQTAEHYALYANYIRQRHRDGDMYPPTEAQYKAFLTSEWGVGYYLEFRLEGRLIGVAVCDRLGDGLSAVYTFFDPACEKRSLGVFSILTQIRQAARQTLPFVYLGYWIKDCQKMEYKLQYRPIELLINRRWVLLR